MRLKTSGKIIIFLLVCGVVFGGFKLWNRIAPEAASSSSGVPTVGNINGQGPNNSGTATNVTMPRGTRLYKPAGSPATRLRLERADGHACSPTAARRRRRAA